MLAEAAKPEYTQVVLPAGGFGTGLAELGKRAPKTFAYLEVQVERIRARFPAAVPPPRSASRAAASAAPANADQCGDMGAGRARKRRAVIVEDPAEQAPAEGVEGSPLHNGSAFAAGGTGGKQVRFVMMFSDDLKQDSHYVTCGETHVNKTLIPEASPHVTETASRVDGAGCFRSNFSRLATVLYGEWTGLPKKRGRLHVPGGAQDRASPGFIGPASFGTTIATFCDSLINILVFSDCGIGCNFGPIDIFLRASHIPAAGAGLRQVETGLQIWASDPPVRPLAQRRDGPDRCEHLARAGQRQRRARRLHAAQAHPRPATR